MDDLTMNGRRMHKDRGRIMDPEEQLRRWVAGDSVHNGLTRRDGECCPDFSCCMPQMAWPMEKRAAFQAAPEADRHRFLMSGLRDLVDNTPDAGEVVIIGDLTVGEDSN